MTQVYFYKHTITTPHTHIYIYTEGAEKAKRNAKGRNEKMQILKNKEEISVK